MIKKTIVIISSDILFPLLFETLLFQKINDLRIIICKSIQDINQKLDVSVVNLIILDSILNDIPSFEIMRYIRMEKRIISPIFLSRNTNGKLYI